MNPLINRYSDKDYLEWLKKIDEKEDITVTDWEARFIETNLSNRYFSPSQRNVILGLVDKYL